MGRKKVEVEYIQKDKKRSTTYDKRKKGLLKKAYELATLCDVPLCMVIYPGPNSDPVTYPEKREEVGAVIDRYVSGSREENAKRNLNLQQGLALGKKRKPSGDRPGTKRLNPVGPPSSKATIGGGGGGGWYPALDGLSREELVKLASVLDSKLRQVEERMRGSFGIYNGNANAITTTTATTSSAAAFGDHVQIAGAGFDHGMQWPMSPWQPDDIGSSSYDPNAYVGPNFYYAQVGPSHSHVVPQPQPLTAFYGGTVKFEPHQTPRANPGLMWYEQGKFFL